MKLHLRRIIIFAKNMGLMTRFYEAQLGLKVRERADGFVDFDAGGGCRIALHVTNTSKAGRTKICFYAKDVSAVRAKLVARGVKFGKDPGPGAGLKLCDAKDPEKNLIQLSNRP
jgi:predicted enzyme related to lactoylglutathione lyase